MTGLIPDPPAFHWAHRTPWTGCAPVHTPPPQPSCAGSPLHPTAGPPPQPGGSTHTTIFNGQEGKGLVWVWTPPPRGGNGPNTHVPMCRKIQAQSARKILVLKKIPKIAFSHIFQFKKCVHQLHIFIFSGAKRRRKTFLFPGGFQPHPRLKGWRGSGLPLLPMGGGGLTNPMYKTNAHSIP